MREDFGVWKEYAYEAGIHPAVLSYLDIRRENFYRMETSIDGRMFATPRGWEDLSQLLYVYEKLGKRPDREVVCQYIQHQRILPIIWSCLKNIRQITRWIKSWRDILKNLPWKSSGWLLWTSGLQ